MRLVQGLGFRVKGLPFHNRACARFTLCTRPFLSKEGTNRPLQKCSPFRWAHPTLPPQASIPLNLAPLAPGGTRCLLEKLSGGMKRMNALPPVKICRPIQMRNSPAPAPPSPRAPTPLAPAPHLVLDVSWRSSRGDAEPERAASFLGSAVGPYPLRSYLGNNTRLASHDVASSLRKAASAGEG
jgi:hypothetical protein